MSNESSEVQLARLEERLKTIFSFLERQEKDQIEIRSALTSVQTDMANVRQRMENVETSLTQNKPVIDEFITIKHKVVGAGMLGKWVWAVLAGLIGFLYGARNEIYSFLSSKN